MNQALQIRSALAAEQLPAPSQAWLQAIIAQQTAQQRSLPALVAAAKARLLAADLTTPGLLEGAPGFPAALISSSAGAVQEARLAHDVVVQVLDLENLAQSRWQHVQALEAIERGEQKRGREIIRIPVGAEGEGEGDVTSSERPAARPAGTPASAPGDASATHRLVLQDAAGHTLFALELSRIYRIGVGRLHIGEKLLIKGGTVVARGILLLEPTNVKFLGGQVEPLHKAWTEGRLARLRAAAQEG